ncbi:MAG: DUF4175 family protein [Acetobacter sp.]|uniref:DUF4175 domain-containing protein n=1 Tax=Acetobacter sp. TaxID=440 RepID=UPI0039EA4B84
MGGPEHSLTAPTAQNGGHHTPDGNAAPPSLALARHLAAMRQRARLVLRAEYLRPALLPPLALLGLYCLGGLLRVPQHLPDSARLVLLAAWLGLCGWRLRAGLRGIAHPTPAAIDRRIEQASGLANAPLSTLADRPAPSPDARTALLWQAHQQRVLASLGRLRAGWPHLLPHSRAGQAAGSTLLAALVVAGVLAGSSAPGRILAAFIPGRDDPDVPLPRVEAWITTPSYTPNAPVFLKTDASGTSSPAGTAPSPQVPQGSHLTVIVSGIATAPVLRGGGGLVLDRTQVQQLDTQSWRLNATLAHGGTVRLAGRGRTLAFWPVNVLPDAEPEVKWGPRPGAPKGEWRTRLPYEASHAYGLSSLGMEMRLAHPARGMDDRRVLSLPVPLAGHQHAVKGVLTPDLSEDPWAGMDVTGTIVAQSLSGRRARSAPATFTLGARVFHSPLARAILDVRRRFALGQESRADTASDLETLGDTPGPIRDHSGMALNLAAVIAMLDNSRTDAHTAWVGATNMLWDLALDIEDRRDGDDASAQASLDVRAAQAAVAQQLAKLRTSGTQTQDAKAELDTRLQALRDAISRKMQALANAAIRNHTAIPDLPGFSAAGDKAFSRLMKQLQSDAANGHSEDALKRLQDMENATERMRNATPQDLAALARQMVAQQKAQEQMAAARDLTARQTGLLDHAQSRLDERLRAQARRQNDLADDGDGEASNYTSMPTSELLRQLGLPVPQDADQANAPPAPPPPMPDPAKAEAQASARRGERATQHALERATEELQNEFKDLTGKAPAAFDDARTHMREARKALTDGDDATAATAEEKALEALRKGRQQMSDAMKGNGQNSTPSFLPSFGSPSEDSSSGSGSSEQGENGSGQPSDETDGANDRDDASARRDPLGRKLGEGRDQSPDDSTHIPDTVTRQRAREIEQELRRRDSDRTRPQQELDYLDRLLKPF